MATIVSAVVMVIVMPHVASLDSIIRQTIRLTMTLSFDEKKGTAQYNNTHFENETTPKKWMAPD